MSREWCFECNAGFCYHIQARMSMQMQELQQYEMVRRREIGLPVSPMSTGDKPDNGRKKLLLLTRSGK